MDLTNAVWHKSTRSQTNGQCVEVANNLPGAVAVRDSKDQSGTALTFAPEQWRSFISRVKTERFGR